MELGRVTHPDMHFGLDTLVAGVALLAVVAYGVLGGADFGGGIWDILARGPKKEEQRRAIAKAMGPVWEANHVWLIFLIVILFTAFPPAYAALSIALFVPFHLVLVGITLRGGAFVFRGHGSEAEKSSWGIVFGGASVITPVLLGMSLGAVSAGNVRIHDGVVSVVGTAAWLMPISIATGLFALAICSYLAAVYLSVVTEGELREIFRAKALGAGTAVVVLSLVLLPLVRSEAPHLWSGLGSGAGATVLALGAIASLASGALLYARRFAFARVAAIVQVSCLLAGWGVAQHPFLIYPDMSLGDAAAPPATLRFVLYTLPLGLALIVPSMLFLFRVFSPANTDRRGGNRLDR
jgi:cytochrome bd ubiquinol oxidase subunit II